MKYLMGCSAAVLCLATLIDALSAAGSPYPSIAEARRQSDARSAPRREHSIVSNDVGAKTPHALRGLFCNTPDQIDEAVTSMRKGLSPRAAVELVNRTEVACSYVDLLRYIIERPVVIDQMPGSSPLFKHEGTLVGVVVGEVVRPVTPPVQIFFALPERLVGAPSEGRA